MCSQSGTKWRKVCQMDAKSDAKTVPNPRFLQNGKPCFYMAVTVREPHRPTPGASKNPSKKRSAQKDVKMEPTVVKNDRRCPKWSPKWIPKSTQNRSKIEVLGRRRPQGYQPFHFGGPRLIFRCLGAPPEIQNRRKLVVFRLRQ